MIKDGRYKRRHCVPALPHNRPDAMRDWGAVKVDGAAVTDPAARWTASSPAVLQVGSRKFVRISP